MDPRAAPPSAVVSDGLWAQVGCGLPGTGLSPRGTAFPRRVGCRIDQARRNQLRKLGLRTFQGPKKRFETRKYCFPGLKYKKNTAGLKVKGVQVVIEI